MKKIILALLTVSCVSLLSGCILDPYCGGFHHEHFQRD